MGAKVLTLMTMKGRNEHVDQHPDILCRDETSSRSVQRASVLDCSTLEGQLPEVFGCAPGSYLSGRFRRGDGILRGVWCAAVVPLAACHEDA